jgi:hypothetical protein
MAKKRSAVNVARDKVAKASEKLYDAMAVLDSAIEELGYVLDSQTQEVE